MDRFIQSLVQEHHPRRPLVAPERRVWLLAAAGFALSAAILGATGKRHTALSETLLLYFAGEALLIACLLVSGLYYLLLSVVPGESTSRGQFLTTVFSVAWLIYLVLGVLFGITPSMPLEGRSCLIIIGAGAVLPIVLLTREARKGMALQPRSTAFAIALVSAAVGVLGLEAHCEWESAVHHIVFHLLPVFGIAAAAFALFFFLPKLERVFSS